MRRFAGTALCLAAALALGAAQAGTASAHNLSRYAAVSYFCAKHPNSASCIKVKPSTVPSTGGGGTFANAGPAPVVYGILGAPHAVAGAQNPHAAAVTQLPPSGGAASLSGGATPPQAPDRTPLFLLLGLVAAGSGGIARVLARRRI
jgi:hypothetical protein